MDDQAFKLSLALFAVIFLIMALFCWTLFQVMQRVPRENQKFPSWLIWLFLIPRIGIFFQCVMLPFGIPNALKKTFPTNQDAIQDADMLFKIGLADVISTLFGFLPIHPLNQIASIIGIILWITYWVLIMKFKNNYLKQSA